MPNLIILTLSISFYYQKTIKKISNIIQLLRTFIPHLPCLTRSYTSNLKYTEHKYQKNLKTYKNKHLSYHLKRTQWQIINKIN